MLEEVQNQGKDRILSTVQGQFMSYSCTTLTKSLVEYSTKYLNETEETREKGLKALRQYFQDDIEFPHYLDDIYYLCFLRSRKFNIEETIRLLKKGADFVDSNRQIFDRVDSEAVRRAVESRVIGFLPYRDSKGRAIVFMKSENWDPEKIKVDEIIFGSMVTLHSAVENPVNQVAGFVIILDFKNLKLQQIIAVSSWLIFGIQALQRCCPCLVKEFHIIHTPAIFRGAYKIVKPLISEKIRDRITFYKSAHWDSLHRKIPPEILPEELGGQLGPFSNDHWTSDLANIERKYYQLVRCYMDRKKAAP